jgi:Flp pilus assembly protein TadB
MNWVTITPDWAAFPSLRRCAKRLVIQAVKTTPSEADMQTTSSGQHGTHLPIAEALWILAGIVLLIAFGDALALLALTFAIVTMSTAWWIYRQAAHRAERSDAELAPVTRLRPAWTAQRDRKETSAHASWRGPSAAA